EGPTRISWSIGPVLPGAQSALGTTVVGDSIVVVGGTYWVGPRDGVPTKIWATKVWRLDTGTKQWSELPDYPLPTGYCFAVGVGQKLYVSGGMNANEGHAETFILDLAQKNPSWTPGPPLPKPRWTHHGGVSNGVIYIAAGTEGDPSLQGDAQPASDVLALDTRNLDKGWRYVANVPHPEIEWRSGTVCNGKLYLFGGLLGDPDFVEAERLVRAWHNVAPLIPRADSFALDLASGSWERIRRLPIAMGSGGCAAIDDNHII
ncbi:unnamed protein product, partial [marine sediment metagenome]